MPAQARIKPRRDTSANWASANPVLQSGEIGFDTTTGQFKIGDGTTAWSSLTYVTVTPAGAETLTNKTLTSPVLGGTTTTASGNLVVAPASTILEVQGGSSVDASIQLNCYVNTHGQKIKAAPHAVEATNTLLLPGGSVIGNSDATLVSDTGTQTLTNKTIDGNSNTLTVLNAQTTATASANNNTIVLRDGSANTAVNQITLGVDPTQDMHAATKAYVDALASGVNWHVAVKAAQASNISNGTYTAGSAGGDGGTGVGAYIESNTNGAIGTVDGYQMLLNDRLLYIGATNQVHNGIYVVSNAGSAGTPWRITRAANFDGSIPAEYVQSGDAVYILNGTNYGNQGYIQVNIGTGVGEIIKVGTDSMSWQQFTGAASIIAGTALSKSGNTLSVVEATQSVPGYLSASDKTKLDALQMPISFHIAGTLSTGVKQPRFISTVACTLVNARAYAGGGSGVTYRLVKNGSTNGNTSATVGAAVVTTSLSTVTSLAVGDTLQVEIVNAGTSGADLSVTIEATY